MAYVSCRIQYDEKPSKSSCGSLIYPLYSVFIEVKLLSGILVNHGRANAIWPLIGVEEEEYFNAIRLVLMRKNPIRITASSAIGITACRPLVNAERCQAGSKLLYVTYQGNIYPCASKKNNSKYLMCNITDKKAEDIESIMLKKPLNKSLCSKI